ncbi:SDR family NAD(P)-dependent oxidoreductase [Allopusillimonas soli]|uniref:SDR family NAD(P)-dependent oxidoreductase n=1 Tax=Allopusillimonas soli TaxID=659016 RepID=A0A853FFE2_9BURK|nr:SDR family NAD(P)-dependent oxidoreductase [Allopusillimonas soli]NYT38607.1 SDR family NAD(P)-dependent oxidoreductase [Allopusillimonas soli]TEA71680.1 SDR family NAD(P)-dependent oxidoreductase [Allopusillimonas soli]
MTQLLQGRIAIVTGAGRGLGRAHALELARHGAKVLVSDLDADRPGADALAVVNDIRAAGGEAHARSADVTDPLQAQAMVQSAIEQWGRVDILVNNAGILRDKTFAKMSLDDFRLVMEVHLMGAVHCTHAVWNSMRDQNYGRIVMTTSSSGLYGNFGQANYGAAKMALVGLMQTLALEGERYDIRVNCLAPTAATAMTEGLLEAEALNMLSPAAVSPAVVVLAAENAPTRTILMAGAGGFEQANITMTQGIYLGKAELSASSLIHRLDEVSDRRGETIPATGFDQLRHEVAKARTASPQTSSRA